MNGFGRANALLAMQPTDTSRDFRKSVTQASAPSIIQPQEADRLIDLIVDQSTLWPMARVIRMNTNEQRVRFVDLTAGVLQPATCGTQTDTASITASVCTLRTVELRASVPVCDNVLEDNIEGPAFEAHFLQMMAKAISNELELWALMSNTSGVYHSPYLNAATEILIDGWYQQMQSGHVLDAVPTSPDTNGRYLHVCKLAEMENAMPDKYMMNPSQLRFFMPRKMITDYKSIVAARPTPLGDSQFTGKVPMSWGDIGIQQVTLLPTDMAHCSGGSFGGASDGTFMFLTDPQNLILGIQRQITYERWRDGSRAQTWHVWSIRADAQICVPDATVLYDCMAAGSCNDVHCTPATCA
jgi:hypothetical protein